jgi:hypothetical protein
LATRNHVDGELIQHASPVQYCWDKLAKAELWAMNPTAMLREPPPDQQADIPLIAKFVQALHLLIRREVLSLTALE